MQTGEYCKAVLGSDGGNTMTGLAIGRLFRQYNIHTYTLSNAACSSICASMFLGGTERTLRRNSELFFHAPYDLTARSLQCNGKNSFVTLKLKQYTMDMLGEEYGLRVHKKSMRYCSASKGWIITAQSEAKRYHLIT